MEYEAQLEKILEWVGPRLISCPVRDGVSFYQNTDKIFKIRRRRKGWYLEFSVPVPACPDLKVLSSEEVVVRKLGRTRWIYRGTSDEDVRQLVVAAMASISQPRAVEPAMMRDMRIVTEFTCPCLKKMEKLQNASNLPQEISQQLKEACDLLRSERYNDFIPRIAQALQNITSHMLHENGIEPSGDLRNQLDSLIERGIISSVLKDEVAELFRTNILERHFEDQMRAYPLALMLVSFTSKLINVEKLVNHWS
ncbi:hypothetical protein [Desulfitobacterium metallireducens]|uniref:Uncharacterized protein n=1 Tax=Desulfitobacterium metallireducens DSM 15288 TaxID=871968 RepID=W0EH23_9FIRM|nr:hypothetical protein [Desulfitobacterium metallireducens]AHF08514.1 hypothetical protein DESME_06035 [Desulfitobacterium metallireducens DSM 15288]